MITTAKSDAATQHDLNTVLEAAAQQLSPTSPVLALLHTLASALARGADITALPHDQELTPDEAATLTGISHPHLLSFMSSGALTSTTAGPHHRIEVADLLDFIERRQAARTKLTHTRRSARTAPQHHPRTPAPLSDTALADLDTP